MFAHYQEISEDDTLTAEWIEISSDMKTERKMFLRIEIFLWLFPWPISGFKVAFNMFCNSEFLGVRIPSWSQPLK